MRWMLQGVKRETIDSKIDSDSNTGEGGGGLVSGIDFRGKKNVRDSNDRVIVGSCTFHEDPDLWFPELPAGRPTRYTAVEAAVRVREATDICDVCPIKQSCLDKGFLPENILWGIWGGMMAGERLVAAVITPEDYTPDTEQGRAFSFVALIAPWI